MRNLLKSAQKRRLLKEARDQALSPGAHVSPRAQVLGWNRVRIGRNSVVGDDCWLNVNDRSGDTPAIVIGDFAFVGRRNFLSAGAEIRLGHYCLTGVDCHFLGSDHPFANPLVPYHTVAATTDGVIVVGVNCWLGASVTILKGVTVGHGSVVGAGAVLTKSIPPFSLAVGNPARVIRRYDFIAGEWKDTLSDASEKAVPDEAAYLAMLRESHPHPKLPRIAADSSLGDL